MLVEYARRWDGRYFHEGNEGTELGYLPEGVR